MVLKNSKLNIFLVESLFKLLENNCFLPAKPSEEEPALSNFPSTTHLQ